MLEEKIRKEKLSIYLVRDASKPDSEILKLENTKDPVQIKLDEADSVFLYIKKEPPSRPPAWTTLFTSSGSVPIEMFGNSSSVGAVLVVRVHKNTFLISFGSGFHLLQGNAIERDFGLRVTLNSVDPDKLRSLDKASYDHNPLNSRTQSTKDADIFELHVDSELEMLYAVTGASKVEIFGTHVTGRDALTVMIQAELNSIPAILKEALARYDSKLPGPFEWVDNINRVRDSDDIEILDLELETLFKKGDISNFWLGEPEVIDWESQIGYSFDRYAKTPRHIVLKITDFLEHLQQRKIELSLDALYSTAIHVNNNEYQTIKTWSVYRCLYAEIVMGSEQYILRNGTWYRINTDFVKAVDDYLSTLNIHAYKFPIYAHDREDEYNEYLSKQDNTFVLMDKKNIKIGGSYDKLEFCDLIKDGCEFVHIKYYRSSSTLSHLFSQGTVAAEAFIKDLEFREKLNPILPASIQLADPKSRPNPNAYKIVYAIATNKSLPDELPFFSKVTLKNALKTLQALDYSIELARIDIDPALLVKKKFKPKS